MNTKDIQVKIFNPSVKGTITVAIVDTVAEAIELMGNKGVIDVINEYLINKARVDWRNRMIHNLTTEVRLKNDSKTNQQISSKIDSLK